MWWEGVLVTELAPHSDDLGIMAASGYGAAGQGHQDQHAWTGRPGVG